MYCVHVFAQAGVTNNTENKARRTQTQTTADLLLPGTMSMLSTFAFLPLMFKVLHALHVSVLD